MSLRTSICLALALGALGSGAACSDDDDDDSKGSGGKAAAGEAGASGETAGSAAVGTEAGAAGAAPAEPAAGGGGLPAAGAGAGGLPASGGVASGGDSPGGAGGEGGAPPPNVLLDALDGTLRGAVDEAAPSALYFFGADLPAGPMSTAVSTCVDACLAAWPVFHASPLVLPMGLNAADFAELERPDGALQTTFKGWPLYYYAAEVDATSRTGEGAAQLWHAVEQPFYSLVIMKSQKLPEPPLTEFPLYLADGAGRTIYELLGDTAGTAAADPVSSCTTAGCRRSWPVVSPMSVKAVSSMTGALDIFIRPEGQEIQVSYAGLPIYYFNNDKLPGDLLGVGKTGWVLSEP